MIEITVSAATQHRSAPRVLPPIIGQRRRRSLDKTAPTSSDRRRHTKPHPNPRNDRCPRPVNPVLCSAPAVPTSRKQTLVRLKSP